MAHSFAYCFLISHKVIGWWLLQQQIIKTYFFFLRQMSILLLVLNQLFIGILPTALFLSLYVNLFISSPLMASFVTYLLFIRFSFLLLGLFSVLYFPPILLSSFFHLICSKEKLTLIIFSCFSFQSIPWTPNYFQQMYFESNKF